MNVLVTAIGSMSAECVVASLREMDIGVVATDIYPREYHPIVRQCADFRQVQCALSDVDEYCSALLDFAIKNTCAAIVPLTDPEVDVISAKRNVFEQVGIDVWLADDSIIRSSRDKEAWGSLLSKASSFKTIPSFATFAELSQVYSGDFVAKRVRGRSSEGILFSNTASFNGDSIYEDGYVFQPMISGNIITVDFARHPKSMQMVSLPRMELIRTKNGAGTVVKILPMEVTEDAVLELANMLGLTGVMNCEFIQSDGGLYLMDINPRFSAGVSFSKMAGYDFVRADVDCYCNSCISEPMSVECGKVYVKRFCDF